MTRSVYEYEVQMRVKASAEKAELVTLRLHAYSVMDAVAQAACMASSEAPGCDVTLVRVGPPSDVIAASTRELVDRIEREVQRLGIKKGE